MPTAPQRKPGGFNYPENLEQAKGGSHETAHRLYGAGVDAGFKGQPKIIAPWQSAGRTKSDPRGYDPQLVQNALKDPSAHMAEIDPRHLHATQPWVTRGGVDYYSGQEYRETGRTFADQHQAGNRYPVVYQDRRGQNRLLSGHHRATAALLHGRQFQGIFIQE
jgi:hypothetical protein